MDQPRIIEVRPTPENPLDASGATPDIPSFLHFVLTQAVETAPCEVRAEYLSPDNFGGPNTLHEPTSLQRRSKHAIVWRQPYQPEPDLSTTPQTVAIIKERWLRPFLAAANVTFSMDPYGGFNRWNLLSYQGKFYRTAAYTGNDGLTGHWLRLRISGEVEAPADDLATTTTMDS